MASISISISASKAGVLDQGGNEDITSDANDLVQLLKDEGYSVSATAYFDGAPTKLVGTAIDDDTKPTEASDVAASAEPAESAES